MTEEERVKLYSSIVDVIYDCIPTEFGTIYREQLSKHTAEEVLKVLEETAFSRQSHIGMSLNDSLPLTLVNNIEFSNDAASHFMKVYLKASTIRKETDNE